ncbi:MAG: peptidyl-alpha-hydroxyglycine alpha-amidating lyase family protein [Gemmatimonadota bacterium]
MKRFKFLGITLLVTALATPLAATAQFGRANPRQDSIDAALPRIPYESIPLHLQTPDDRMVGETVGVDLNSEGHIFVFTRTGNVGPAKGATAAALYEFDHNGNWIKEWGHGSYAWSFAHEVNVDRYDNVWVTDEGSNMVVKFNPQGEVEMVLGRKAEAIDYIQEYWERPVEESERGNGAGRPNSFGRPTNVTWDLDDNIFVADGYTNSRVAKFSPTGDYLGTIGQRGREVGQFSTPHDIDSDAEGNIYVADRGNNRIQVLDPDLNVIRVLDGMRSPWAICITPPPNQYIYSADASGKIYKSTLDGEVVGMFGEMGKALGQFYWIHSMSCPSENEIYIGEVQNWRVQHVLLSPPVSDE